MTHQEYRDRLDEILAKHGAEPGEMTHSLKQAIKQLVADEMLGLIGEDDTDNIFPKGSDYWLARAQYMNTVNDFRDELRTKLAEWLGEEK